MAKSYMRLIIEDLAPYLVTIRRNPHTIRYKKTYVFNIKGCKNDHIHEAFNELVRSQLNWRNVSRFTYTWATDSVKLEEWYNNPKKEGVEDIPSDAADAFRYAGQMLKSRFITKKENEMKFSARHILDIEVNGKKFKMEDPIKPSQGLEAVQEMALRADELQSQIDELDKLSNTSNLSVLLKDELNSINDMTLYIDSNLKEE